jgi:hypothetical protein
MSSITCLLQIGLGMLYLIINGVTSSLLILFHLSAKLIFPLVLRV